jgi:hypothetical protein
MNPYIMQSMAAEHQCDLRRQAAAARRARQTRRTWRGGPTARRSGI